VLRVQAPPDMRSDTMSILEMLCAVVDNRIYLAQPSVGLVAMLTMLIKLPVSGGIEGVGESVKKRADLQRRATNLKLLLSHQEYHDP
jgi:hypothetical protein